MTLRYVLAAATAALALVSAPPANAQPGCGPGGPPLGAVSKDVSDVYGQPATLWITARTIGISTAQGYGEASTDDPSPLQRTALIIDAQQDGNHQIIVDTGRDAHLYTVTGCTITTVVDEKGAPWLFDVGHRRGNGDGYGCGDLGNGPHLVGLLLQDGGQTWRRTEIDLNGATATIGRSDTVPATSDYSCGGLTMARDGVQAPY